MQARLASTWRSTDCHLQYTACTCTKTKYPIAGGSTACTAGRADQGQPGVLTAAGCRGSASADRARFAARATRRCSGGRWHIKAGLVTHASAPDRHRQPQPNSVSTSGLPIANMVYLLQAVRRPGRRLQCQSAAAAIDKLVSENTSLVDQLNAARLQQASPSNGSARTHVRAQSTRELPGANHWPLHTPPSMSCRGGQRDGI